MILINLNTANKLKDNIWGLCLYFVQLLIHYKERDPTSDYLLVL